jgi:hypothetical protein
VGKVFVQVVAEHNVEGQIKPLSITWDDGRVFEVDRLLDVRMAASLKAGGQGTRYTCRIRGMQVYLFHDEGKWFIESNK